MVNIKISHKVEHNFILKIKGGKIMENNKEKNIEKN